MIYNKFNYTNIKALLPFTFWSMFIYLGAFISVIFLNLGWKTTFLLASGIIVVSVLLMFIFSKDNSLKLNISKPKKELIIALLWYILYFLFDFFTTKNGIKILGDFQVLMALFIAPLLILMVTKDKISRVKDILNSVGITIKESKYAIKIGGVASVVMIPFIIFSSNYNQRVIIFNIFKNPFSGFIYFMISFVFAFLIMGLPEEFFFRGFLQSRFSKVIKSEWKSILITSFLFGLYHLPNLFLNNSSLTHGHIIMSIIIALTEQGFVGILFGIIWAKTHNLSACIFVHSFIDAFYILSVLKVG